MASITIAGRCFVVTSKISLEDLTLVSKYRPKALKIVDEDDCTELFAVGVGGNSLSDYGISFSGTTNDEKKLATVTLHIPADAEDVKEYVTEKASTALINLNQIESRLTEVLDQIRNEHKAVNDSITVIV